jgi:hypothetical protein
MIHVLDSLIPLGWVVLWVVGGWLLASTLFCLRRGESAMVGLGLGLMAQIWLANALSHVLPTPASFWLAAALVGIAGIAAWLLARRHSSLELSASHWLLLGALTLLFYAIGRGLGIFDDYQNLPTISLMAAGDVPPHFALNPALRFGYHYLLLLLAGEVMRIGNMFPWSALDLTRAVTLALPLILAGLWAHRLTGNRLAAMLTGCLLAFASGTRWLLLLLPPTLLSSISANVTLIGSAATSAPNLAQAMISNWKIDGAGPIPFPFAFYSGINQPYIMAYTGIAGSANLIMLLILLTAQRWRHWSAAVLTAVLLSCLAIANEIAFLLIGMGVLVSAAAWMLGIRGRPLPVELRYWMLIMSGALALAVVQGGMLTEILRRTLVPGIGTSTYFDATPVFVWPPAIISAHLGSLSFANPLQLTTALLEIGPVVVVTPVAFSWGWKSLRLGRWYEASLIATSFGAVLAIFVAFKGPLYTATPRLMGGWFFICSLYAVPLTWIWLKRHSDAWKAGAVAAGLICGLGGLVLFGVQLAAIQKPTYASFITPMDAKMSQEYWNKLPSTAWVFDPVVFRAPTIFGRFTESSPTWYARSPEWQALADAPDPFKIRAAGFGYMYFDSDYWGGLTRAAQLLFAAPCVKQLAQVDGIHGERDFTKDFRRLLDIHACAMPSP